MRVKRGVKARKRRNRLFKLASGFRGRSKNTIRQASARVDKALAYATRDRRAKKRDFRALWISRISAAVNLRGISYSKFFAGLKRANIDIDRKILADLCVTAPKAFDAVTELAK